VHPGAGVERAHALVRERVDHLSTDRDPQPDIRAAADMVRTAAFDDLLPPDSPPVG
jgi:histidine ammonia-lyase